MKLYEISQNYQNIAELLADPEFAENQDVINALDAIEDDFNHKAEQVVFGIKNTEYQIDVIDAEIKRLQAMKKATQNKIDGVKDYLKINMAKTGIDKVKCALFTISYREVKDGKVEVDEDLFLANNVNEELVTVKITPSKTAIKNALNRGENIVGARLVDSPVLTIK